MNEDRIESLLRKAERGYNVPPPTPREEMWARIQAARRAAGPSRRTGGHRAWARWGAAIAATLALGIGIGRLSTPASGPPSDRLARVPDAAVVRDALPYRLAAVEYLSQAETLLTTYRTGARVRERAEIAEWGRELLTRTRLLLDSPAASDPRLRLLLEDLELVLAQVARISPGQANADAAFVSRAIEEHDMLLRLRTAVPAGPFPSGI